MTCECGCGYQGEDPVAQYLLEEACMTALDAFEIAIDAAAHEQAQREAAIRDAQAQVRRELAEETL